MTNDEPQYYIVVETIEDGEQRLAAVPRAWEKNGKLMWPPKSKQCKALKTPTLLPGTAADGWQEFDCEVKRKYIPTYAAALNEMRQMSDLSDTASDADDAFFRTMVKAQPNRNKDRPPARKVGLSVLNADCDRSNFNSVRFTGAIAVFRFCINYGFRFRC